MLYRSMVVMSMLVMSMLGVGLCESSEDICVEGEGDYTCRGGDVHVDYYIELANGVMS